MDPITAIANLITALTKLVTVIAEGQTQAQREIIWGWYIRDVAWWRRALKLDDHEGPKES